MKSMVDISAHTLAATASVREALSRLNALPGSRMTLFALNEESRAVGSLTDGDIRRALLRGISVDSAIDGVMNRNFHRVGPADDLAEAIMRGRGLGLRLLPRLDEEGHITDILDLNEIKGALPLDAVLMAGGKGERLRPLTINTPKPLLKVGDKAIIDYNVDELRANGIENIFVTVNYLKEQIIAHFDGRGEGVRCVAEPTRMGTFGSLSLVAPELVHDNVLVMNSDLLTTISFDALYRRHLATGADLTMSVVSYNVSVPYAILETEGNRVAALREKPVYNYFANAGVYLLKRELLSRIAPEEYLDAPDFIESLIADGKKVSYYLIDGIWIDIGSPADFTRATELMSSRLKLNR